MINIFIAFHSIFGHTYTLAENIAIGASKVSNTNIKIARIKETLPIEVIRLMHAEDSIKQFEHLPIATVEDLDWADCIVLGAPTYFGKMSSQLSAFMDCSGPQYASFSLKNKVGGAFTSTGTPNGGSEETLHNILNFYYHHSMIPVGIDCSNPNLERNDVVFGTTPYGVSSVAGEKNNPKEVNEIEIKFAQEFGERLAQITAQLKK